MCRDCRDRLRGDLADVGDLAADLVVVLTRRTRVGARVGGRSSETPLPFDPRATPAASELRATMRRVAAAAGMVDAARSSTVTCADWLRANLRRVVRLDVAWQVAEAVAYQLDAVRRVCDRPADLIYIGRCGGQRGTPTDGCAEDLYARPGAPYVKCRGCGANHDVTTRQEWLLRVLEDHLATATEIARAVSRLGEPVRADRVWQWKHRGRLSQRGVNDRRDPLFRVGDVLDLLLAEAARREAS
ncbi:MAG: hypothetical protein J2P24_00445 [Streptosporangiales bacterium]|nr:hypothetical protein [Streptosporangiales bacterium]